MSDQTFENSLADNFLEQIHIADNVLAKQFYSLPVNDRNAIHEEIHGVQSMAREETPESIAESLRLLSIELQKLPRPFKLIYERACAPRKHTADMGLNNNNRSGSQYWVESLHVPSNSYVSAQGGYPRAETNSCYVKSQNFQLAFLRCEFFDARKAALRMAKYLELVVDLYGEEALFRPLRVDDFKTKEEIEVMDVGFQQLLPFRDRFGRRVLFIHGDMNLPSASLRDRSVLSKGPTMKALLYVWSVLIEDVEAQRKGLVGIFWPRYVDHGHKGKSSIKPTEPIKLTHKRGMRQPYTTLLSDEVPDANSRSTGIRFFEALPIRVSAMHICLPDIPYLRMIRNVLFFIMGESFRSRVKFHDGVGIEVVYSLMGYGIPVETLPFDEVTQVLKTKNFASFLNVRRKIEAEQSPIYNGDNTSMIGETMIECPSLHDVIFRPGKSYMSHPGNMMFRELIEKHIHEHNAATQERKKNLTWQVIDEVETKGGRFLEYNRSLGTWTELNDRNTVRHKIATYFKEYRRKVKAQQQLQTYQSSTHDFEAQDGRNRKKQKCGSNNCF